MATSLIALVLLALVGAAVVVTVVDAVRAPYWRGVALERRRSWQDRAEPQGRPHSAG